MTVSKTRKWPRHRRDLIQHSKEEAGTVTLFYTVGRCQGKTSLEAWPLTEWKWAGYIPFHLFAYLITLLQRNSYEWQTHFLKSYFYIILEMWWVTSPLSFGRHTLLSVESSRILCDCKVWSPWFQQPRRMRSENRWLLYKCCPWKGSGGLERAGVLRFIPGNRTSPGGGGNGIKYCLLVIHGFGNFNDTDFSFSSETLNLFPDRGWARDAWSWLQRGKWWIDLIKLILIFANL